MSTPPPMKAAVSPRYGPPDLVRIEEVVRPTPEDDELLVKVHATTVNRTDCGYRSGKPFLIRFFSGLRRPKVSIWGTEFAGDIVAIGSTVTSFRVGDRVCGYCEGTFGAHAQYMTVRASRLIVVMPEGATFESAAPSTEGSHYALGIMRAVGVRSGDDILIYGATGAIGSAAVKIAKSLGLKVTAVCGTAHVALVSGLGADKVVDYQTQDFTKDEQKYDLVLDAVGRSSFWRCRRLLKPRGIYTSTDLGRLARMPLFFLPALLGRMSMVLVTRLFRGRRFVFLFPRRDPEGIRYLKGLIESGEFKPVIDPRRYRLDEIVEAYRYVETGQKIGNVVITVDHA